MQKRLKDIIHTIDYYELLKIKKDLDHGGIHLTKFIENEIKERQKQHHTYCTTCDTDIDPHSSTTQTLIFGSEDFKKKATFCGKDCLQYFLKNIEEKKNNMATHTTPKE